MISDHQCPLPLSDYLKTKTEKREDLFFLEKTIIKEKEEKTERRRGMLPLFLFLLILSTALIPMTKEEAKKERIIESHSDVVICRIQRTLQMLIRSELQKEYLSVKPEPLVKEEEKKVISPIDKGKENPPLMEEVITKEEIKEAIKEENSGPPPVREENRTDVSSSPSFYLNGVHDIALPLNSSMDDLIFELTNGISCSSSLSISYEKVNLSVPGNYSACYLPENREGVCIGVEVRE